MATMVEVYLTIYGHILYDDDAEERSDVIDKIHDEIQGLGFMISNIDED